MGEGRTRGVGAEGCCSQEEICLPEIYQQKRVYPYPLGAGSARPNPNMDPENPLFLGFSVLRGGLRPWSQTMVGVGVDPETVNLGHSFGFCDDFLAFLLFSFLPRIFTGRGRVLAFEVGGSHAFSPKNKEKKDLGLQRGSQKGEEFRRTRVRGTMFARGVQKDTIPSLECDCPPLF